MTNKINGQYKNWLALPLIIFPLAFLAACSDGKGGNDGEDGYINMPIKEAKSLMVQIEAVNINDNLNVSVYFYLSNKNGVAVSGLAEMGSIPLLGLGIAKLGEQQRRIRPLNSGTDAIETMVFENELEPQWTSYINRLVQPGNVADNDLELGWDKNKGPQWQAGIESSCKQECLEAVGNGLYRYTFTQAIDQYSTIDELNTHYEPKQIHRVYLELLPYSGADVNSMLINTSFDFNPETGLAVEAKDSRRLLDAKQSCYRCHTQDLTVDNSLLMHGNKRFDYEGCVMCHTNYSGDPETGVSIGMASLVHKIHKNNYLVIGYKGTVHDYSKLAYPGDMMQCQQCHIEDATEQANFYQSPGQETCLSCHEKDAPEDWNGTAVGLFHDRSEFPKAWELSCSGCHPDNNNPQGSALFHNAKASINRSLADKYKFELTASTINYATDTLSATLNFSQLSQRPDQDPAVQSLWLTAAGNDTQVQIPENNAQRKVWDITSDSDDISLVREAGKLKVQIRNIGATDFALESLGTLNAKVFVCGDKQTGLAAACDANQIIVIEVPASAAIALMPGVKVHQGFVSDKKCEACHDKQFDKRVTDAHYIVKTPENGASCGTCHAPQLSTGFADTSCRSCHTTEMVKYMNATLKHTSGIDHIKHFRTLNNSLNYRELVHSIHASTRETKGPKGEERAKVTYPAKANDCRACHDEGQLEMKMLNQEASVIVAAEGSTQNGEVAEYSPTVAVCASCHLEIDQWAQHARSFGGVYQADATSGAIYQSGGETCHTCHGEGKTFGVDIIHKLKY
jgi:OmcA/MtrC family decaheme c-type cytochrome